LAQWQGTRHAQSFTAELTCALDSITHGIECVHRFREKFGDNKKVAILSTSDGQSWIRVLDGGPYAKGPYVAALWAALCELLPLVEVMVVGFKFAHCGDRKGDIADEVAKCSAKNGAVLGPTSLTAPWSSDALVHELAGMRRKYDEEAKPLRGAFAASIDAPTRYELPSRKLPPAVTRDICRLRSGHWWRLGKETIFRRSAGDTAHCIKCGAPLARDLGPAVEHLFDCPTVPAAERPSAMSLKSGDDKVLRDVHT
jgi:hypothetical protein